jgi:hypothetical protein
MAILSERVSILLSRWTGKMAATGLFKILNAGFTSLQESLHEENHFVANWTTQQSNWFSALASSSTWAWLWTGRRLFRPNDTTKNHKNVFLYAADDGCSIPYNILIDLKGCLGNQIKGLNTAASLILGMSLLTRMLAQATTGPSVWPRNAALWRQCPHSLLMHSKDSFITIPSPAILDQGSAYSSLNASPTSSRRQQLWHS